jgi:SAM-dependent methyltransferase
MTTDDSERAYSLGAVARAYDVGRPTFPADALTWILGPGRLQILDLGAGTGKLTAVAAALGHDVVAIDPSEDMLALCRRLRGVDTMVGTAESIPLAHGSVDAVIVGQAFHWFDHARALPEIARVLRPSGVLGLLWNNYDTVVPWVRRLHRAMSGWAAAACPVALAGRRTDRVAAGLCTGADRRDLRDHSPTAGAAADAVSDKLLPDPAERSGQLPAVPGRTDRPASLILLPAICDRTVAVAFDHIGAATR